jgi:LuxR family transcriptional activator of bioluminescence operon
MYNLERYSVDMLNCFHKNIENVNNISALKSTCSELCQHLELDYYAIYTPTSTAEGKSLSYCSNIPKSGFGNNKKHRNPILEYSKNDFLPIVWEESLSLQETPHPFSFGVGINTRDCGFLSFGGNHEKIYISQRTNLLIAYLPILANIATQKFSELLNDKEKKRLSKREIDCLNLSAKGLKAEEISKIMCITKRTVYFHLTNIKKRLRVKNIVEAYSMISYLHQRNEKLNTHDFIESL